MDQYGQQILKQNTALGGNLGAYPSPSEMPKNEITSLIHSIGAKVNILNEALVKHAEAISTITSPCLKNGSGIPHEKVSVRSTQIGNELDSIDIKLSQLLGAIDDLTQSIRL